jgi:hypothetical protein
MIILKTLCGCSREMACVGFEEKLEIQIPIFHKDISINTFDFSEYPRVDVDIRIFYRTADLEKTSDGKFSHVYKEI